MKGLRDHLIHFADHYPDAKKEPLKGHPLSAFMRYDIPDSVRATGLFPESEYKVAGSVGKGTWAEIPWIAVYKNCETDTLHHGLFIILVYSADLQEVHLSINQGSVSYFDDGHTRAETNAYLLRNASDISSIMDTGTFTKGDLKLGASSSVGRFLQLGNICSRSFCINNLPDDEELSILISEAKVLYDRALEAKRELGLESSPY